MKSIQRIILWKCYLAVFFLASTASLQAQPTIIGPLPLTIHDDRDVPRNVSAITNITSSLTIGGGVTSFPNFAALEEVGAALTISMKNSSLTELKNIFPALKTVRGHIIIRDNNSLTTISGFDALTHLGGIIINDNNLLATIPSFDALTHIGFLNGGNITIYDNSSLTTISGFGELTRIDGNLLIYNNSSLTTLSGFNALTHLIESFPRSGRISISANVSLKTISGFDALTRIEGDLLIQRNAALTTISGFDALKRIEGELFIESNRNLTALPSFDALTYIKERLLISNNNAMTTVSGFAMLNSVGNNLQIGSNAVLTTLSGFAALNSVGGDLSISFNRSLSACCDLLRIAQGNVTVGGSISFYANAAGCRSADEIKADCTATRVLSTSPTNLTAPTRAGRAFLNVAANVPWRITKKSTDTWITSITPNSGMDIRSITIVYEDNAATTQRMASLTLAATDGGTETMEITLTQAGVARHLSAHNANIPVTASAGRAIFNVSANVDWGISQASPVSWISSISPPTGRGNQRAYQKITIGYKENTSITTREAILTLAATDGGTETVRITLTQAGRARQLSADKTNIPVNAAAASVTFDVTANVPWDITKRDTDDWVTSISPNSGMQGEKITIAYEENTSVITARDAILTLTD